MVRWIDVGPVIYNICEVIWSGPAKATRDMTQDSVATPGYFLIDHFVRPVML